MDIVNASFYATHALFAGLWTGSVVLFTIAVLPLARDGSLDSTPLSAMTGKLTTLSRISAVLLLATGSHMAANRYTADTLTGSTGGHLVLTMLTLWLVLIVTVEVGAKKIRTGLDENKLREPAHNARRLFLVAGLASVLLLVNAGLLGARNVGFLPP